MNRYSNVINNSISIHINRYNNIKELYYVTKI